MKLHTAGLGPWFYTAVSSELDAALLCSAVWNKSPIKYLVMKWGVVYRVLMLFLWPCSLLLLHLYSCQVFCLRWMSWYTWPVWSRCQSVKPASPVHEDVSKISLEMCLAWHERRVYLWSQAGRQRASKAWPISVPDFQAAKHAKSSSDRDSAFPVHDNVKLTPRQTALGPNLI